jgi:HEAT repeat protein
VRLAAVHALARKDLRDTEPRLAALVTADESAAVRVAAKRALAR